MKKSCFLFMAFIAILFSTSSLAQNKISGKITDSKGEPLVGASVLVKGTNNGTVTNNEGIFTFDNIAKGSVLIASFVGYISKEFSSDGTLSISLEEGEALEELIVTAENRAVSAQTLPITMELVSGKAMQRQGATDLSQLQNLAPICRHSRQAVLKRDLCYQI